MAYDVIALENPGGRHGLGLRGVLPVPASLEDFAGLVRRALKANHVRMVGKPRRRVRRIAVIGGGAGELAAGMPADIDVLVTGDVKYHDACAARERGLSLIDAGHAPTERLIAPVITAYLRKVFPGLPVKSYVEPDCFHAVTE